MFFFFKPKTAYERRISDWSSDVCSSDLEHGRHFRALPTSFMPSAAEGRVSRHAPALSGMLDEPRQRPDAQPGSVNSCRSIFGIVAEIGRASWRERVGKYV